MIIFKIFLALLYGCFATAALSATDNGFKKGMLGQTYFRSGPMHSDWLYLIVFAAAAYFGWTRW